MNKVKKKPFKKSAEGGRAGASNFISFSFFVFFLCVYVCVCFCFCFVC